MAPKFKGNQNYKRQQKRCTCKSNYKRNLPRREIFCAYCRRNGIRTVDCSCRMRTRNASQLKIFFRIFKRNFSAQFDANRKSTVIDKKTATYICNEMNLQNNVQHADTLLIPIKYNGLMERLTCVVCHTLNKSIILGLDFANIFKLELTTKMRQIQSRIARRLNHDEYAKNIRNLIEL